MRFPIQTSCGTITWAFLTKLWWLLVNNCFLHKKTNKNTLILSRWVWLEEVVALNPSWWWTNFSFVLHNRFSWLCCGSHSWRQILAIGSIVRSFETSATKVIGTQWVFESNLFTGILLVMLVFPFSVSRKASFSHGEYLFNCRSSPVVWLSYSRI